MSLLVVDWSVMGTLPYYMHLAVYINLLPARPFLCVMASVPVGIPGPEEECGKVFFNEKQESRCFEEPAGVCAGARGLSLSGPHRHAEVLPGMESQGGAYRKPFDLRELLLLTLGSYGSGFN